MTLSRVGKDARDLHILLHHPRNVAYYICFSKVASKGTENVLMHIHYGTYINAQLRTSHISQRLQKRNIWSRSCSFVTLNMCKIPNKLTTQDEYLFKIRLSACKKAITQKWLRAKPPITN